MLTSMDWLEAAPKDFKEQLRALQRDRDARPRGEVAAAMAALADHVLDENQLVKLARLAKEFLAGGGAEPLVSLKLGVFGDGTLSLITPVIAGSGLRHRLLIETFEGEFNRALLDAADPASPVRAARLDMALIASDARVLGLAEGAASRGAAEEKVRRALRRLVSQELANDPSVAKDEDAMANAREFLDLGRGEDDGRGTGLSLWECEA